ncbi:unnamed protein product [Paramecium sonneborni]|uniref:Uncharacterized protein n=1 Tax=Paramecium sonneborni TaxID=65129 RepID=A0A8S1KXM6_9CILI|nr:unnamed protein product [Paramecium sonneborni]
MTSNQMELEFNRFQKQSSFTCAKERLKQVRQGSNQQSQNTPQNKSATFSFKNQKIKFRFPLIDELSLDSRSIQQESMERCYQQRFLENHYSQNKDFTKTSIEMEEENKENINNILIQQPFYDINKIVASSQISISSNQQIQNKMNEQYF